MPSWTYFGHPAYRYRNEKGQWASDATVRNWGHASISENAIIVKTLASGLTSGSLTVGQWEQQMRDAIKTEYIAQYLLGKGGRDNMTSEDWGSIGGMIADQYRYLDNFASEIAAGNLSEAQIAMRSAMYIRSSREAFERATARVRGIPDMPAFPGDGSTKCLVNCACYWAYRKRGNTWECTWNLTAEENCEDCIDNASKWNPLVLQIGEKTGHFVTIDDRPVFIGGPGAGAGSGIYRQIDIDATFPSQSAVEDGISSGFLDYDENYILKIQNDVYEVHIESWWDDCMESRGLGITNSTTVMNSAKDIMVTEAGWRKADIYGHVGGYNLDPTYGVIYIGRKLLASKKAGRFVTIDERPVFIGGPGAGAGGASGEGSTLDEERDSVQEYVSIVANLQRNIAIARGFEYGGLEHIVEDVGQFDVGQPLPYSIERGELKECYRNAYNLMLDNSDLTYVEGIAMSRGLIPLNHAWCVNRHGLVVDNTWHNPEETAYFGVHLSRDFVISVVLDKGSYTIFDHMSSTWREIINNGMPLNALEGEETKAGRFVTIDERPVFIGGPGAGGGGTASTQARGVLATGENELYRWSNLQEIYDLSRGKRKSSLDTTSAQDFYFAPPSMLSKDTWPSRTYGRMILDRAVLKDAGWKEDPQLTAESAWRLFGKEARAQNTTDIITTYLNSIQGFEIDKLPQGVTLQDVTGWLKYRIGRDIPVVIQDGDWAGKAI